MNTLTDYLMATLATVKRDAAIFLTYRLRVITELASMFLTLTMFFYISKLVRPDAVGHHGSYYVFVVVGILFMALVEGALTLTQLVRMELVAGNFERVLISPFGPVAGVAAMAAFPIANALVFAGLTLGLAAGVFAMPVHISGIPLALLIALLGGLAFAALGLIFVAALIAFKSSMGAAWILSGLALLGGAYFPVALFPGSLRWISQVQPLTPSLDLLRHELVGSPLVHPAWTELVKVAGFTVCLIPLATVILWRAVKLSRRRGTLMEY